ncbi:hypothetical protein K1T71_013407 [Dendrolimus kikuchii]|uniref:Uncharacterized protein n=1 Tax=Dendrolimus kikuchii TaxID=765133 RepID=A0ACC1CI54_9NEOP|nr:hypothetical protein K1T71_013407 [Dendrolimus kikuchii]
MAICGCTPGGIFISAILALVLLPAQYYVPDFYQEEELDIKDQTSDEWLSALKQVPAVDIFIAGIIVIMVVVINLCEWIQRKLMERKIYKLNQYLTLSLERLRAVDAQQDELEATLKMVHNATSEYNLLLYLLLREQRILTHKGPPSNCFFDKTLNGDIDNLTLS